MKCRGCGSTWFHDIINLGVQRLSDFRDDNIPTESHALWLMICNGCKLVQLSDTVPRDLLYHGGYGYRSGTNEAIRANLRDVVDLAVDWKPHAKTWLDIASNDGTLLSFVPDGVYRVGVDPVKKFAPEAIKHADLIIPDYFDEQWFLRGEFDIITSVSMFYDIDDLNAFVADVKRCLKLEGIWIIQQNYLLDMIKQTSFDNVCHEHLTYFSLASLSALLRRHGLEVNHVQYDPVNGGVIRTVVSRAATHVVDSAVALQIHREQLAGLTQLKTFLDFKQRAEDIIDRLHSYVRNGRTHYIYGASTRGATMWQAAKITEAQVPFAVERSPEKVGKYYSALGIPIISEEQARRDKPDVMLVGPWWHRDLFIKRETEYLRDGGKLLFPLPSMEEFSL